MQDVYCSTKINQRLISVPSQYHLARDLLHIPVASPKAKHIAVLSTRQGDIISPPTPHIFKSVPAPKNHDQPYAD